MYAAWKSTGAPIQWLTEQLESGSRIGLPWHSLLGFARLVSNRAAFPDAMPVRDAWQLVLNWLKIESVWIPLPTARHSTILSDLFTASGVTSRAVMDAHLAALAIEHGLTLCSADTGFARYKQLRWMNPLTE